MAKYLIGKILPFAESDEHSGSYCRAAGEELEWLNPPMIPDTEYRTAEKWNGKPVYTVLLDLEAGQSEITTEYTAESILRRCGHIGADCLPVTAEAETSTKVIWVNASVTDGYMKVSVHVGSDYTGSAAQVQLWYTKP